MIAIALVAGALSAASLPDASDSISEQTPTGVPAGTVELPAGDGKGCWRRPERRWGTPGEPILPQGPKNHRPRPNATPRAAPRFSVVHHGSAGSGPDHCLAEPLR